MEILTKRVCQAPKFGHTNIFENAVIRGTKLFINPLSKTFRAARYLFEHFCLKNTFPASAIFYFYCSKNCSFLGLSICRGNSTLQTTDATKPEINVHFRANVDSTNSAGLFSISRSCGLLAAKLTAVTKREENTTQRNITKHETEGKWNNCGATCRKFIKIASGADDVH